MNTTYREVQISYDESNNLWNADGYRKKQSLAIMKAAIDRQLDKPDSAARIKTQAMHEQYGKIEVVTITSMGEDGSLRYTNSKGKRAKASHWAVSNFKVFDQGLLDEWNVLNSEIEALKKRMQDVTQRMTDINVIGKPTTLSAS